MKYLLFHNGTHGILWSFVWSFVNKLFLGKVVFFGLIFRIRIRIRDNLQPRNDQNKKNTEYNSFKWEFVLSHIKHCIIDLNSKRFFFYIGFLQMIDVNDDDDQQWKQYGKTFWKKNHYFFPVSIRWIPKTKIGCYCWIIYWMKLEGEL